MRKLIITSILSLFVGLSVHAQSKQESIKTLLHLTGADSLYERYLFYVLSRPHTYTQGNNATKAPTKDSSKNLVEKFMNGDLIPMYDKYFTEKEIKEIVAFYRSSSGQKLVKKLPDIQQDALVIFQKKYLFPTLSNTYYRNPLRSNSSTETPLDRSSMVQNFEDGYGKVFTKVEHPASFPGGAYAWKSYVEQNLNIKVAHNDGAPVGNYMVKVQFIVDKAGKISNVQAIQTPPECPGCGPEAVRLIKKSPDWEPARQNGRTVIYQVVQPIIFQVFE